jgi:ankyrin repeat protein
MNKHNISLMNFVSLFGRDAVPLDFFDEFIKAGCDVNLSDNVGYRPIHAVSTSEWVKLLLARGADINATNGNGENAVHIALREQKCQLAKFLLLHTNIDRYAVNSSEVSYIGYITLSNVNNHNDIFCDDLEALYDELVEKHINSKTLYGGLLINAFISIYDLKRIRNPKADLHQMEPDKQTCLHRAVRFRKHSKKVKLLVNSGLDINAVNESGFTPLMFSIDFHCSKIANFLIEQNNINLNLANDYGFTALHYAARNTDIKVLCNLLLAGADPKFRNKDNQTFYDILCVFHKKLFSFYDNTNIF